MRLQITPLLISVNKVFHQTGVLSTKLRQVLFLSVDSIVNALGRLSIVRAQKKAPNRTNILLGAWWVVFEM